MTELVMDRWSPADEDTLLLAVVNAEFRALITQSGFASDAMLPAPIEPQEQSLLDRPAGSVFAAQCKSTCSEGPFTFVCDGTTK